MSLASGSRSIRVWLLVCTFMIFSIVAVGGLTRLTRSGLSIVEWKPISGIIPPLNEEQWQVEFEKYKQFPEYQRVNKGMELEEFKGIFYWEYGHRVLGRLIGFVFALPLFYFLIRRRIKGALVLKLVIALFLGGLQGFVGWIMVKSGLVNQPRVSHFRLALHLGLALFLMSYLYWIARDLALPRIKKSKDLFTKVTVAFLALVALQIFYGALTAGLRAGHFYNTFPKMNGYWIPADIGLMAGIKDIFENPVTVQFLHRCLGWMVFFAALALGWTGTQRSGFDSRQRLSLVSLAAMALLQFTLGIFTLLQMVPVSLGSLHQMGAAVLLLLSVRTVHVFRNSAVKGENVRAPQLRLLRFEHESRS